MGLFIFVEKRSHSSGPLQQREILSSSSIIYISSRVIIHSLTVLVSKHPAIKDGVNVVCVGATVVGCLVT